MAFQVFIVRQIAAGVRRLRMFQIGGEYRWAQELVWPFFAKLVVRVDLVLLENGVDLLALSCLITLQCT